MAQLDRNPIVVSSTDMLPLLIATTPVKSVQIEFTDYTTNSDSFTVTDSDGKLVWEGRGNGDLSVERSGIITWVHKGLKVTKLDSGKLIFYVN